MFSSIGEKTLYIFGVANMLSLPMVWAFYPESNQRTLEEMDLLFEMDSWWNWDAERHFRSVRERGGEGALGGGVLGKRLDEVDKKEVVGEEGETEVEHGEVV